MWTLAHTLKAKVIHGDICVVVNWISWSAWAEFMLLNNFSKFYKGIDLQQKMETLATISNDIQV